MEIKLNTSIYIGAVVALLTGFAVTIQSTITSRAGALIGDFRTGLLTNALGGLLAGALILFLLLRGAFQGSGIPLKILMFIMLSGLLGIFIISGISFSLQRTGVAAGLASVILGQLILSVVMDRVGAGAAGVIPISVERVIGMLIIAGGVHLLLPRA